jgi:hypothetical protein
LASLKELGFPFAALTRFWQGKAEMDVTIGGRSNKALQLTARQRSSQAVSFLQLECFSRAAAEGQR